ncbi:MAG TPA: AI-2E family transporter [Gemmatimonadales bacterium]|nr:AI-2E family transporter [Gemmatimonadales bacterium]
MSDDERRSSDEGPPDLTALVSGLGESASARTFFLAGLFVLASVYTLYFARAFFLPVAVALLLDFLLTPVVRWLKQRLHLPESIGAALLLLALVGVTGTAVFNLAAPAAEWLDNAPATMQQVRTKLEGLRAPVARVSEAAKSVEQATAMGGDTDETVTVRGQSLGSRLFGSTANLVGAVLSVLFLTYFLLAAGDLFLRKLVEVLPRVRDKKLAVTIARETEEQISGFMLTATVIHVSLGIATGFAAWIIGLPNPALWGVLAGMLNFIPYIGPLINTVILLVAGLVTFESTGQAFIAPAAFVGLNFLESNIITPNVMADRMSLNTVAVFGGILFWWFLWGVPGAIMAVPLLAVTKTICDHVEPLRPIGEFLGQ